MPNVTAVLWDCLAGIEGRKINERNLRHTGTKRVRLHQWYLEKWTGNYFLQQTTLYIIYINTTTYILLNQIEHDGESRLKSSVYRRLCLRRPLVGSGNHVLVRTGKLGLMNWTPDCFINNSNAVELIYFTFAIWFRDSCRNMYTRNRSGFK